MSDDFVICARAIRGGHFIPEPGKSTYLLVPENERSPSPAHAKKQGWIKQLRQAAIWGKDERDPRKDRGDVLVYVHGFNSDQDVVMQRHRQLKKDLAEAGFKGVILSFDWPSADMALNYLEDRHDAKITALQLVDDGIRVLAREQGPDCTINVHLLAHSMGAYVVREAFDDADDSQLAQQSWMVSQVVFIAGDVSVGSMEGGSASSNSLYRHCIRLTNYSNRYDSALKLSNFKRAGVAPRVGREGLPAQAPGKAVNVDCSDYFHSLDTDPAIRQADQEDALGYFDHSWYIGNRIFTRDLFETLRGDFSRTVIPTRWIDTSSGALKLKRV